MSDTKADLVVRELGTGREISRVHLTSLNNRYVEGVMMGMLRNMHENYYIDDSEVDAAREDTP